SAKEAMAAAQKTKGADQGVLKAMATQLLAAQSTYELATKALAAPGKLADNADMKAAADAIKGKVGEMATATKWQQEQVDAGSHGTGRHGAQTGIEKQAGRVASDITPDQDHNEGGTASRTAPRGRRPSSGKRCRARTARWSPRKTAAASA